MSKQRPISRLNLTILHDAVVDWVFRLYPFPTPHAPSLLVVVIVVVDMTATFPFPIEHPSP